MGMFAATNCGIDVTAISSPLSVSDWNAKADISSSSSDSPAICSANSGGSSVVEVVMSVGVSVGHRVGADVGLSVGGRRGAGVGTMVGARMGAPDTVCVGTDVGAAVGASVGDADGAGDGALL